MMVFSNSLMGDEDMGGHIIDIFKSSTKESQTNVNEGFVLHDELLNRVLKAHMTSAKSIPLICPRVFS